MSALATTKSALALDLGLSQLEPPIYVWSLLNQAYGWDLDLDLLQGTFSTRCKWNLALAKN